VAQQWWQPANISVLRSTSFGSIPPNLRKIAWDGANIWVANHNGSLNRVRASDGFFVDSYSDSSTPDFNPHDVLVAAGSVFATSLQGSAPGRVYRIDPMIPSSLNAAVTVFADNTGFQPVAITFDGQRLWTANSLGGSITAIVFATRFETTFTAGFTLPVDILWDGENLWVVDQGADQVKRINPATGAVLQSIAVGDAPSELLFDGANLWVSNTLSDSVTVIRAIGALRDTVLDTITGNGLDAPTGLAFDGERVLVTNNTGLGSVSLFKAADLTPLGNLFTGVNSNPFAACSDGLNFWIVRQGLDDIVRF
jgi:YVTN family beta-propeller protein